MVAVAPAVAPAVPWRGVARVSCREGTKNMRFSRHQQHHHFRYISHVSTQTLSAPTAALARVVACVLVRQAGCWREVQAAHTAQTGAHSHCVRLCLKFNPYCTCTLVVRIGYGHASTALLQSNDSARCPVTNATATTHFEGQSNIRA